MDKWNTEKGRDRKRPRQKKTEKGQDRKRPRQKELKDQVEEQERKRRWKSGIQKKAKTEKGRDRKRPRRKKAKTESAKRPGRKTREKERSGKSGIQCHDNPEIPEKGEDITHPQQTDSKTETD